MSARAARTRTLIQLGGLVEKAGLAARLGIRPGDDVQAQHGEAASVLLGALLAASEALESPAAETYRKRWGLRGRRALFGREPS